MVKDMPLSQNILQIKISERFPMIMDISIMTSLPSDTSHFQDFSQFYVKLAQKQVQGTRYYKTQIRILFTYKYKFNDVVEVVLWVVGWHCYLKHVLTSD